MTRTYLDTGVLITLARGEAHSPEFQNALSIVDDPQREFVCSVFLRLELLPKPLFNGRPLEVQFYQEYFSSCVEETAGSTELLRDALTEATAHGLGAVDAMHIVAADGLGAEEFVTTEGATKSIHRTTRLAVRTIK